MGFWSDLGDKITGKGAAEAATAGGEAQAQAIMEGQKLQQAQIGPAIQDVASGAIRAHTQLKPYQQAGQQALNRMGSLMATPYINQPKAQLHAPTAESLAASPAVQFRMQEAQRALETGAAARGGLFGGGHQRQLAEQMQGLASQEYDAEYRRKAEEQRMREQQRQFGMEFGRQQQLQRIAGNQAIAGMGQVAASQVAGQEFGAGGQIAGIRTGSGASQAAAASAAGQARASGAMGAAQSYQQATGNLLGLGGTLGAAYLTGGVL